MVVLAYAEGDGLYPTDAVSTSTGGDFHFSGLPDGTYRFAFVATGSPGTGIEWHQESPTREGAMVHVVTTATTLTGIDGTLQQATAITGTVTDQLGDPVSGVLVAAYGETDGLWPGAFTTTDADGRYALRDLPPGPQRLVVVPPGYYLLGMAWYGGSDRASAAPLQPAPGTVNAGIDVVLSTVPGVSGTITGPDGQPLFGATVWAYDADDGYVGSAAATTFGDGTYVLALPDEVPYRLLVVPPAGSGLARRWYGPSTTRAGATPVTPVEGDLITGIDVALV